MRVDAMCVRLFASLAAAVSLQVFAQAGFAQSPPINQAQTISSRAECPVEPHKQAIDPEVVRCHALFAPLPVLPPEINTGNADHLEVLREHGDELLRQLDRPEACGKGAKVNPFEACALLIYVIDEAFEQANLPWTYVVKIHRARGQTDANRRSMVLTTVAHNNNEERFGPEGSANEVWRLLADQRVQVRCKPREREFLRETVGGAVQRGRIDTCVRPTEDVRYRPVLVLGRGEADQVLNRRSIRRNFGPE